MKTKEEKVFGLSIDIQKKEINKYCFKECGKIIFGGMIDENLTLVPCNEEKCPYEEKRVKYEKSNGRVVWIRKLKNLTK